MRRFVWMLSLMLSAGAMAQDDKPSPIPSKNKRTFSKPVTSDEPPVASPDAKSITAKPLTLDPQAAAAVPSAAELATLRPVQAGVETGTAFFYGADLDGKKGASGETIRKSDLTAAHASLPLGSRVRVTNLDNGQSVVVRINDRFRSSRAVINLSERAAVDIGLRGSESTVKLEPLR